MRVVAPLLLVLMGAALPAAAQSPFLNPLPAPRPKPSPTPAPKPTPTPSRRSVDAHRARVGAAGYRPYFSGGSAVDAARGRAESVVSLRRSARSKTYIPQTPDKALDWSRVSAGSIAPWERAGGWKEKTKWEEPTAWKGAKPTTTAQTLTTVRGARTSWSERNPLRATYGAKRPAGRR